jgi:hypothetical protein
MTFWQKDPATERRKKNVDLPEKRKKIRLYFVCRKTR